MSKTNMGKNYTTVLMKHIKEDLNTWRGVCFFFFLFWDKKKYYKYVNSFQVNL